MKNYKHIFGPVPSRRMGLSVGISPIPDGHCNYSCIYCQLGRTHNMTNKREEYFNCEEIVGEFKEYLKDLKKYDVVTIVGEGEPLLYKNIGKLILEIQKLTDKPVAVITNGALLAEEEVREQLLNADIVLPSFDAANNEIYKKINRPHGSIDFEKSYEGLVEFSKKYKGQLWIEIMIIKDLNDSEEALYEIKKMLEKVEYDKIYINSPVRPPAEKFVKETGKDKFQKAIDILGGVSIDKLVSEGFYSDIEDDYEAVLSIIKRHPMNGFEIRSFINERGNKNPEEFIEKMNKDEKIEKVNYKNYCTYRIKKR